MTSSIFWYDYETTGIDPRCDRPLQVAGIRTDEQLNEIDEPLNIYCRPSDDILPHPMACLVTGITPQRLAERGLDEAHFMTQVHAQMLQPGTCVAGYNSLRFDDEMTRYSLFRNFFDPYGREWQGGNSRWDLIDVMRTAYALRPEGIVWPEENGQVSLKLERLTAANGIDHGQAHDALSDVRATIAMAKRVRECQPKLYDYLYRLRSKAQVMQSIRLLEPMVHISGRFSAARHYFSIVLPLAWHPTNRNALIVCDLQLDPTPLLTLDAQTLRTRLYTRRDELAADELPVPLKLLHINRCPVITPLSVIRPEDQQRLNVDRQQVQTHIERLRTTAEVWQEKLSAIYNVKADEQSALNDDPEQQLYAGFLGDRDRRLCEQVRISAPEQLGREEWPFDDQRLSELLFRYRARNFYPTLTGEEQQRWLSFCRERLLDEKKGAPNTLQNFYTALEQARINAQPEQTHLLGLWHAHAQELSQRLGV